MMERSASARPRHAARRRSNSWLLAVLVLGCTCLTAVASPRPAWAAEGQWQAGGRLGLAWLDAAGLGPVLEAHLRRGLGESFDVDVQVMSSFHPFGDSGAPAPGDGTAWAMTLSPGLLYRWDTLRAVPYAGVSAGLYHWEGQLDPAIKSARFGGSARLGVDYLLSRDVVLSVQATAHMTIAEGDPRVPWFQLSLGAAHAWGW